MGTFNGKFESAKQDWETPPEFFNRLNAEFNFDCDLAASDANAKCNKYFTSETNAMAQTWRGVCWLNPPYGESGYKLSDWVKKAFNESQAGNCKVVMLIPARTNTTWWRQYCHRAKEVRLICGRPKFIGATHGLPQPLAIVIFEKCELTATYSIYEAA